MSQQESSYFDPEQETVYQPRNINSDSGEQQERQEEQEHQEEQQETVYYVTPEQSMLRGEKLMPIVRTKPYAHWIATAVFVLMILIGGLIWGSQVQVEPAGYPGNPGFGPYPGGGYGQFHQMHHQHYMFPSGDQDDDR